MSKFLSTSVFKWIDPKNTDLNKSQQTFLGLQHVFSVTILRLPRRFEDVLKTSCEDVLKTSCEDVLKTFLEDVEDVLEDQNLLRGIKTSSRRLGRPKIVTLKTLSRHLQDVLGNKKCLLGYLRNLIMGLNYLLHLFGRLTPVDTRCRFNVCKTSIRRRRRRIDVL